MRLPIGALMLFALSGLALADTVSVGGRDLEIPAPDGFTLVTTEHPEVHRLSLSMEDPLNVQLAYYIADADVPVALDGGMPDLDRYFVVKVNKELQDKTISVAQFAEVAKELKRENARIVEDVQSRVGDALESAGQGIGEQFDVDLALSLSEMVPLDPHHEAKNSLAYSMYVNYGAAVDGEDQGDVAIVLTATFVNVSGRVLYLYAYGNREDLEWTRTASKAWAERLLAANPAPPETGPGGGIDWWRALRFGLIVGAVSLVFGLISKNKKK